MDLGRVMSLPRVYPIVESAAWVERLLSAGVRLVQLRVKDRPEEVRREVRVARSHCARWNAQLIVNDYWQLALEENCDFVHLGQGDLDSADVPALRRAGVRVGVSTHDEAELERALSLNPHYVALGPIYPTLLKVMPWAPQGLERIGEWKRRIGARPLVAIGGLTVERLGGVFAAGADVAAVVTDIVRHPNPEARAREWLVAADQPVLAAGDSRGSNLPRAVASTSRAANGRRR
jgi:thiamine-phosphate pyrophosphorylase